MPFYEKQHTWMFVWIIYAYQICSLVSMLFFVWQKQIPQILLLFISMNKSRADVSRAAQRNREKESKPNGKEKWTVLIAKWSIWIWLMKREKMRRRVIKYEKKGYNGQLREKHGGMSCGRFTICVNVLNPSWHLLEIRKQMKSSFYSYRLCTVIINRVKL